MIEAINNNSQANRFEHINSSGKIRYLISMKAMKERFHKQIVRKYKQTYFATARKQLLQQQQFLLFYERVLQSGDDLITLLHNWGYIVFFKHVHQILDQRLYQKLYHQNQKYFLQNLNFVNYLLQLEVLPVEHVDILVAAVGEVVWQYQRISVQNTTEIFMIVEKILTSPKYLPNSLNSISTYSLLPKLYDLTIRKQANDYFFKIIKFCKIISNDNISKISDQQKLHCLQIHILTSSVVQELAVSYYALGDFFQKHHTPDQELYEYGSILDKTMKDITIDRLIDSISYFLIKALTNHSLKKLSVEMGYIQVLFDVILDHLMMHNSGSIHGHQSIWSIFRSLITHLTQHKKTKLLAYLDWKRFKERLISYKGMHYPYLKIQVDLTLTQLSKTNEKNILLNSIPLSQEQIIHQLQQVQI